MGGYNPALRDAAGWLLLAQKIDPAATEVNTSTWEVTSDTTWTADMKYRWVTLVHGPHKFADYPD